ncbi:MAG TPA: hypothetical protein PLV42_03175 [bacterium]|nr:hypothetical protein [bacterium]
MHLLFRSLWAIPFLLLSCDAYVDEQPEPDIDTTCPPPQMVVINHEESDHVVKDVYVHPLFAIYKDSRYRVASDLALGERTEPFKLCNSGGCSVDRYITYTREKMNNSVETIAVTTETAQTFSCGTRYTVYLLGEDFLITKEALPPEQEEDPDDDVVL